MIGGLALVCLAPQAPGPSLVACANRAINGLPIHAVGRHLLLLVQAVTND